MDFPAWLRAALPAVVLLGGCLGQHQPPTLSPSTPESAFRVETVASGLDTPWALAFAPDGRIFVTERAGHIRIIDEQGRLDPEPWAVTDADESGEAGLLGIALHPGFPDPAHVYVYYTYSTGGQLRNRLERWTESDGRGAEPQVLLDGVPGAGIHDGGRIKFGPDGFLYITTGDANERDSAQDQQGRAGKILRLHPDGSVPNENPDPTSPVFTLGHRNPQGLCWHPETGRLYATEHGPSGDDEVNLIEAGQNYGWPRHQGVREAAGFRSALNAWTPSIAPAGCAFFDDRNGDFPAWKNNLFFGTLRGTSLRRLAIDPDDPRKVLGEEVLLDGRYGRLRDVVHGPDGRLYLTTSNRDGRGSPASEDDRVLRIEFN